MTKIGTLYNIKNAVGNYFNQLIFLCRKKKKIHGVSMRFKLIYGRHSVWPGQMFNWPLDWWWYTVQYGVGLFRSVSPLTNHQFCWVRFSTVITILLPWFSRACCACWWVQPATAWRGFSPMKHRVSPSVQSNLKIEHTSSMICRTLAKTAKGAYPSWGRSSWEK